MSAPASPAPSDEPEAAGAASTLPAFLQNARRNRFDPDNPPPPEEPALLINGVPVCHPGNLSAIVAGPKRCKSTYLGGAVAALLGAPEGTDLMGWTSPSASGVVLHLDTEQSRRQHWEAMQRVNRRCGGALDMTRLESYRVTGWPPFQILQLLKEAVAQFSEEPGGIAAIIIDGVADLVESPNDESECFALVRELMVLAARAHAPILTVLHLNPGDAGKVRGHLGSQVERKAETVLELLDTQLDARRLRDAGKQGKARVITAVTRLARHSPLGLEDAPSIGWDEDAGMPVTVVTPTTGNRKPDELKALALTVLSAKDKALPKDIKDRIAKERGVGVEMAKKLLSQMAQAKLVEKVGQHYQLTEEVAGKTGNGSGNTDAADKDGVKGNATPYKGGSLPDYPLPHPGPGHPDYEDPNDPLAGF